MRTWVAITLGAASGLVASCRCRVINGLDEDDAGCVKGVSGVTTLAGGGDGGSLGPGVLEAKASKVSLQNPRGVAVDSRGNVYVSHDGSLMSSGGIDRIDSADDIFVLMAESGPGNFGVAVDPAGNVFVASSLGTSLEPAGSLFQGIRKVDPSGNITIVAGNAQPGYADGSGGENGTARFNGPMDVALDASGNLFVADSGNHRIRKIDTSGRVTTLAGNGRQGYADGTGGPDGSAEFNFPEGVAVDPVGNLYVADEENNSIRKLDPNGNVTTLAGHPDPGAMYPNMPPSYADGTGGPNGTARFFGPYGVAVDRTDNVYVAEYENCRVRKIDAAGNVTTLAGNGNGGYADGTLGPSGTAEFGGPAALAVDACGHVYVADFQAGRIRVITP